MKLTAAQKKFLKEEYDLLSNVAIVVHIPLDQDSFIKNGVLSSAEKITTDLFVNDPPHGIDPINIKVLRAQFLKDREAAQFAFDNNIGLSPEGFVPPYGKDKTPLTGLTRYSSNGLLISTIVVDLREFMTQSVQYDMGFKGILNNISSGGVDRKTFIAAKEWLTKNYEGIPQARVGSSTIDQWPAPRLSQSEIASADEVKSPDFDLDWH